MKATSYSYSEIACPIILGTLAAAVGYWVFRRGDLVKCGAAYLPLMANGQRVEFPVQALAGIDYSVCPRRLVPWIQSLERLPDMLFFVTGARCAAFPALWPSEI